MEVEVEVRSFCMYVGDDAVRFGLLYRILT